MFDWISGKISDITDFLNRNEEFIMRNVTKILAVICFLIAIVYAVLCYRQFTNM